MTLSKSNMNKGSMFLFLLAVGIGWSFGVDAAQNNRVDIEKEMKKIHQQIGHMKPPPELLEGLLDQIRTHCKGKKVVDQQKLNQGAQCLEQQINQTKLFEDIEKAIPTGQLDDVFEKTCKKWPAVKDCLKEFFDILEVCWARGPEIVKIVDESVHFLCGDNNDGGRIAVFLADGGLKCLEEHGDSVKKCIGPIEEYQKENPQDVSNFNIPDTSEIDSETICKTMDQIAKCTSTELRKCNDTTPENVITSMLVYASKAVKCEIQPVTQSGRTGGASELERVSVISLTLAFGAVWSVRRFL